MIHGAQPGPRPSPSGMPAPPTTGPDVPMHLSMWTYPWDLLDIGLDTALVELRGRAGVNTVSLATAYHAGRFLQPRSPRRKAYFPEDGTIYFAPTPARWAGLALQPKVADVIAEGGDVLREVIRRRDAGAEGSGKESSKASSMAVSCWTVCLHNTRLGMLHPGAVTRNAFGDPNYYSLCPTNPDARAYVATLVEDVTHSYRPDIVELESPSFMGFAHGYHHELDGVGLAAEERFLLSLCFCPHCLAGAARAGVDGPAVQAQVRRWIVDACERELPRPRWPDFPAGGIEQFRPWPELHAFLHWRFEPVTSLVAEIRERAHPASRILVVALKDGWLDGCDVAALGRVCEGAVICAYDSEPEEVGALIAESRAALGPGKTLIAGHRLFHPEIAGGDALTARAEAAIRAGADGLAFYNYGLVPAARLDWVSRAAEAARRCRTIPAG